jgi:hypothetical protein
MFQSARWRLSTVMRCVTSTPVCVDEVSDGVQNKAVHLDAGRSNALTSVMYLIPRTPSNILVSVWVRTTDSNVNIMQSIGIKNNPNQFTMTINTGKLACAINSAVATGGIDVNDGDWHHLACVVTPSNGLIATYVDGQLVGSVSGITRTFLPAKLQIGLVGSTYSSFDLDELWVAAGSVGTNEVQLIYNKQAPNGSNLINTQTLTPSATLTSSRTATSSATATNTVTP